MIVYNDIGAWLVYYSNSVLLMHLDIWCEDLCHATHSILCQYVQTFYEL